MSVSLFTRQPIQGPLQLALRVGIEKRGPRKLEGISESKFKKEKTVQAKIVKGQLLISLPLQTPAPSASGKTLIVASSHGVKRSAVTLEGKELCVNANAFIYPSRPDDKDGKKPPIKPKR